MAIFHVTVSYIQKLFVSAIFGLNPTVRSRIYEDFCCKRSSERMRSMSERAMESPPLSSSQWLDCKNKGIVKLREGLASLRINKMERALNIFAAKNNLIDYYSCVERYLTMYSDKPSMEKLMATKDLDLACAFEHYEMKKHIMKEDGLSYEHFHPEHFRKMKIPSLDWSPSFLLKHIGFL